MKALAGDRDVRLLIIDDDRHHAESLADLLTARGFEAYSAPSLEEARWLLDLFRFDVALVDWDMPEQTGPEVVLSLRERDPQLRAIVMSGRDHGEEGAAALGATPFVEKPIQVEGLLRLVVDVSSRAAGSALVVRVAYPLVPYRRSRGGSGPHAKPRDAS